MPEVDLPEKGPSWDEQLKYKHSWRGARDRKIRRIKRLGKKKYAKAGIVVGLVLGILWVLLIMLVWGL